MPTLIPRSPLTRDEPDAKVWGVCFVAALAGLAGLAGFGMLIWAAVSAALGLVTLSVIGLGGIAFFQALPLIGQWWENRLLAARKREARTNPIEQLEGLQAAAAIGTGHGGAV